MNPLIKAVTNIRLLCYSTSNISGMLVPLLAYQLTGSLASAGVIMMIEAIAKITAYLYGTSWVKLLSSKHAHLGGESLRLVGIALLIAIATGQLSWHFLALAAACSQMATAVSNLLFENNIAAWGKGAPNAYAFQIRAEITASLITTVIALVVKQPVWLLGMVIFTQLAGLRMIQKHKHQMYTFKHEPKKFTTWASKEWQAPFKYVRQLDRPLLACMFLSIGAAFPITVIFSQMPFFLDNAFATKITVSDMAIFNLIKLITATSIMKQYLKMVNHKQGYDAKLASAAIAALILLLAVIVNSHSYLFAASVLAYSALFYTVIPFVRKLRQHYMAHKSSGITGVLLTIEAAMSIVASMLYSSGLSIQGILNVVVGGTLVMLFTASMLFRSEKQTIVDAIQGNFVAQTRK